MEKKNNIEKVGVVPKKGQVVEKYQGKLEKCSMCLWKQLPF
jgi:hypothetical protein